MLEIQLNDQTGSQLLLRSPRVLKIADPFSYTPRKHNQLMLLMHFEDVFRFFSSMMSPTLNMLPNLHMDSIHIYLI